MTQDQARISIYIDKEMRDKFRLICAIKDKSMNALLVEMIENCIEENKEALEFISKLKN